MSQKAKWVVQAFCEDTRFDCMFCLGYILLHIRRLGLTEKTSELCNCWQKKSCQTSPPTAVNLHFFAGGHCPGPSEPRWRENLDLPTWLQLLVSSQSIDAYSVHVTIHCNPRLDIQQLSSQHYPPLNPFSIVFPFSSSNVLFLPNVLFSASDRPY
jgi:hypothetical protein